MQLQLQFQFQLRDRDQCREQLKQMLRGVVSEELQPVYTKLGQLSQQVEAVSQQVGATSQQVGAINEREIRQGWDAGAPLPHAQLVGCETPVHVCWTWNLQATQ